MQPRKLAVLLHTWQKSTTTSHCTQGWRLPQQKPQIAPSYGENYQVSKHVVVKVTVNLGWWHQKGYQSTAHHNYSLWMVFSHTLESTEHHKYSFWTVFSPTLASTNHHKHWFSLVLLNTLASIGHCKHPFWMLASTSHLHPFSMGIIHTLT